MSDVNMIPRLLETLSKVWLSVPDWRFGQLVCNIGRMFGYLTPCELRDEQILQIICDAPGRFYPNGRKIKRIPGVIAEVADALGTHPEMSLAQLICSAANNPDPFYIEDEDLVQRLREMSSDSGGVCCNG